MRWNKAYMIKYKLTIPQNYTNQEFNNMNTLTGGGGQFSSMKCFFHHHYCSLSLYVSAISHNYAYMQS